MNGSSRHFASLLETARPLRIPRRTFLKTSAIAGAGAWLFGSAQSHAQSLDDNPAYQAWKRALLERGQPRVFAGDALRFVAFPLGGIGTGQVYLNGKGVLDVWQVVNNLNSQAQVSGAFFAARMIVDGGPARAWVLAEESPENLPACPGLRFSGEYPYAYIEYPTGEDKLPIRLRLVAYTPWIPLNERDSGLPYTFFEFEAENPGEATVDADLMMVVPNFVGWDGYEALPRLENPDFIRNVNTALKLDQAAFVSMSTREGIPPRLGRRCQLSTNESQVARALRYVQNIRVFMDRPIPNLSGEDPAVYWLGEFKNHIPTAAEIMQVDTAVKNGATAVISGLESGLVMYAQKPSQSAYFVMEDWERGTYGEWSVEGEAFGVAPAEGTLENQQPVTGIRGKRFVNSFFKGDAATGRLVSPSFTIRHKYLYLRVGGGNNPTTSVNLRVGDKVVCTQSGRNTEELKTYRWELQPYLGQTAQIEIVDQATGGWGHVLVDDLVFSDSVVSPFVEDAMVACMRDMLPFKFREVTLSASDETIQLAPLPDLALRVRRFLRFKGFRLRKGAEILCRYSDGTPALIRCEHGKGKILYVNGRPLEWCNSWDSKNVHMALVAEALGTSCVQGTGWNRESLLWGSLAIGTNASNAATVAQSDDLERLWREFLETGKPQAQSAEPSAPGRSWYGALCVPLHLPAKQSARVRFVLAWHFPNRMRTIHYGWGPAAPFQYDYFLGNAYAREFPDALSVAQYALEHAERLADETRRFYDAFYSTTLPHYVLDAISANLAILRSPIYVWLYDDSVGGFEGTDGCCPMNCTHVYNYALGMAYFFPRLEQRVREIDLWHNKDSERHFIPHRTIFPLYLPRLGDTIGGPYRHALDGELGTILKVYREWMVSGDTEWLARVWPATKQVMEHVLREHDTDENGCIRGEQPNTYDTHLFGTNTFIGTLYLAALRATEELARFMNDPELAEECRRRFESGRVLYDQRCWNGEYYVNVYDAPNVDPSVYEQNNCYGPGCFSDQLFGEWWAHVLNLGPLLPKEHLRQALRSIFRYNWRFDLSDHRHAQRVFAEGKEKGLLNCTWPKGGRPLNPIAYCDEVWTGIEYHVAATLIAEGYLEEGLAIVRGARERYAGFNRNPWSEIECGGHYARALSSLSLLFALGDYHYHAGRRTLTLRRVQEGNRRFFFITGTGWGQLETVAQSGSLELRLNAFYGSIPLEALLVDGIGTGWSLIAPKQPAGSVSREESRVHVHWKSPLVAAAREPIVVKLKKR